MHSYERLLVYIWTYFPDTLQKRSRKNDYDLGHIKSLYVADADNDGKIITQSCPIK